MDPSSIPESPADDPVQEVHQYGQHSRQTGGPGSHHQKKAFLPPVPRRADNMLENLVERPLENETAVPLRLEGLPATRKDMGYASHDDPFLQKYWKKKETFGKQLQKEEELKRKRQRKKLAAAEEKNATPLASPKKTTSLLLTPKSEKDSQMEREKSSPTFVEPTDGGGAASRSGSVSPSPSGSFHRTQSQSDSMMLRRSSRRTSRAAWNVSSFPLNDSPVSIREFLAMKTLLHPKSGYETKMKQPNCDLNWLREIMAGRKSVSDGIPKHLRSFDSAAFETQLAEDSYHYDDVNCYEDTIVSSPRSCLVLLRNGVSPYMLMKRPLAHYIGLGEVVDREVVELRQLRAEEQRQGLLNSLRYQYKALCKHSVKECVEFCRDAVAPEMHTSATKQVKERYEKALKAMQFIEDRSKRLAAEEAAKREANAEKMLDLEQKLHRKAKQKTESLAQQAADHREALRKKRRLLDRIQDAQEEATKEQQRKLDEKRRRQQERTEQFKQEQRRQIKQKGEENEQTHKARVQQAATREEERRARLHAVEARKADRAEERRRQQHQETLERKKKAAAADEKRQVFNDRAKQQHKQMVETVESKLREADERSKEFAEKKNQMLRLDKLRHEERQREIQFTIAHGQRVQEERREKILQSRADAEERLHQERVRQEDSRLQEKEAKTFLRDEKYDIVSLRLKQEQYARLFNLSQMEERDLQQESYHQSWSEARVKTLQMRGDLRLLHDEAKEAALKLIIEQERETAKRGYAITNPIERYQTPYDDVEARIDANQAARREQARVASAAAAAAQKKKRSDEEKEKDSSTTNVTKKRSSTAMDTRSGGRKVSASGSEQKQQCELPPRSATTEPQSTPPSGDAEPATEPKPKKQKSKKKEKSHRSEAGAVTAQSAAPEKEESASKPETPATAAERAAHSGDDGGPSEPKSRAEPQMNATGTTTSEDAAPPPLSPSSPEVQNDGTDDDDDEYGNDEYEDEEF